MAPSAAFGTVCLSPLREWHVDNGGEFLNQMLFGWCQKEGIRMTRGRSYRKNDQAYVEQRNWLAVRRLVGYDRYSSRAAFQTLQSLYELYRLQLNFFRPVRKLIGRERVGPKVIKHYDHPRTPYQRVIIAGVLSKTDQRALEAILRKLNPVNLNDEIHKTVSRLMNMREAHELPPPAQNR